MKDPACPAHRAELSRMVKTWLHGTEGIDSYLATVVEKLTTLEELRAIHPSIPEAEQRISYGMPAFKVRGRTEWPASPHSKNHQPLAAQRILYREATW